MALGAQPRDVWTLIGRSVGARIAIGLVIGLTMAAAIGRLMRSLLIQTSSTDLGTLLLISVIMVLVSLAASCVSARRAVRIEPTIALRAD